MQEPTSLRCALRTLYEEIAEYRFDYPVMMVPEAGPKESLHYYWYKYSKTPPYRSVTRLDSNGIPGFGAELPESSIDLVSLRCMGLII
jgi:hypothetical protein